MTPEDALKRAIAAVGSKARLAKELGITRQSVGAWTVCPKGAAIAVEAAVRQAIKRRSKPVTRHDLRPDVYPRGRK